jgi:ribonuclease D
MVNEVTLTKTIPKEVVAEMPMEVFSGRIVVVDTIKGLKEALSYLSTLTEIGFDTETRPNFSKNSHYKMSLMQLSSEDVCFLIRLNKFKIFPKKLAGFLKNKSIKKIGLSLRDDFNGLHTLTKTSPDNFIDLQNYVLQFGIEEMSLRKIYAILFGKKSSKSKQ